MSFLIPTYKRFDVQFVRGEGVFLYDEAGNRYIDFLSGIGVNVLGYSHPLLVKSLKRAAENPWHVSNYFKIKPQELLASEIVKVLFPAKVFFSNSGAEANEAAIKFARLYGKKYKNGAYKILVAKNSFHGRTLATISATGQKKVQNGFEPLCPGFEFFEFNNLDDVLKRLDDPEVVAVMLEPIQGEGGVVPAKTDFLYPLRIETRRRGILLILDEVQTGVGRTGDLYAFQGYGIQPDLFTSAKALAGGLPIGALIVREELADIMGPGTHGSTFGGNPLVTSVALDVIKLVKSPDFLGEVRNKGEYFGKLLVNLKNKYSVIRDVRGKGFMWGMEVGIECGEFVKRALGKGVISNCTAGKVIRFLPPLIMEKEIIEEGIKVIEELIADMEE